MADLMGDNIGLRELAGLAFAAAQARLDLLEEGGVEINGAVIRAIERSHGRLGHAACRACCTGKHYELRRLVCLARRFEDCRPMVLGVAQDCGNELSRLVVPRDWLALSGRRQMARNHFRTADKESGVNSQSPGDQPEYGHRPETEPTCADHLTTAVFNVAALSEIVPAHRSSSSSKLLSLWGAAGCV